MRLSGGGVALDLPPGWGGEIDPGDAPVGAPDAARPQQDRGPRRHTVVHAANFPLPAGRGDFGNGAVQLMRSGDVFVALFEYEPASASAGLFRHEGIPTIGAGDFDPAVLQKPVPGGSAVQRFFRRRGRAFSLYVVVGSHLDRRDVLPDLERLLDSIEVT